MIRSSKFFALLLLLLAPLLGPAQVSADDVPTDAIWYMHANLALMRTTDSGRGLYAWFEEEAGAELKKEFDVDLTAEIDRLTAFSHSIDSAALIVEGPLSETLRQKLMAVAVLKGNVEEREHRGAAYFAFEEAGAAHGNDDAGIGFFTFDVDGKLLVAMQEAQLKALMDDDGRLPAAETHDDAMFVFSADNSYVQAGMQPGRFAAQYGDDDWNSHILRNTEQALLFVSDESGAVAIDARLKSADAEMTQSIGNIVSGLISLQAFNDELDAPLVQVLNNTKVEVAEQVLSVSTVIEPAVLMQILED